VSQDLEWESRRKIFARARFARVCCVACVVALCQSTSSRPSAAPSRLITSFFGARDAAGAGAGAGAGADASSSSSSSSSSSAARSSSSAREGASSSSSSSSSAAALDDAEDSDEEESDHELDENDSDDEVPEGEDRDDVVLARAADQVDLRQKAVKRMQAFTVAFAARPEEYLNVDDESDDDALDMPSSRGGSGGGGGGAGAGASAASSSSSSSSSAGAPRVAKPLTASALLFPRFQRVRAVALERPGAAARALRAAATARRDTEEPERELLA
jgi:hypothetical protein